MGSTTVPFSSKHTNTLSIRAICGNVESSDITLYDYFLNNDGNTNKISHFGSQIKLRATDSTYVTCSYDSTNNQYGFIMTSSYGEILHPITSLDNLTDNFIVEWDAYITKGCTGFGVYYSADAYYTFKTQYDGSTRRFWVSKQENGSYSEPYSYISWLPQNQWVHHVVEINGTNFSMTCSYGNNSITQTHTIPNRTGTIRYGLDTSWNPNEGFYLKNLIVKLL